MKYLASLLMWLLDVLEPERGPWPSASDEWQ